MEGLAPTSGANIRTMMQQLNQPSTGYSVSSPSTSPTGTSSSTTTTSTSNIKGTSTTPITSPPTTQPSTGYSVPRTPTSGVIAQYPSAPTSMAPPQTVAPQPSMTVPQVTETTTATPTGVAHLWIGWKIEPWEEEIIQKFIEAFEHGKHVHRPPIMLPMMGGAPVPGALVSMPGAPAPGAPVVVLPPQGAGNQQQLTV
jgi:hypothetical protein